MSFTVKTADQALFGGQAFAEVKISATRNVIANTFTVTVDGIRGYSKYEWNFQQYVHGWLATSSDGANAVRCPTTGNAVISGSGSNSYTGYVPSSGYSNKVTMSKTYNATSDGKCPDVWLYFKSFNNNITWLKNGQTVSFNVSTTVNIKDLVQADAGGQIDRNAPTITTTASCSGNNTISLSMSSNYECDNWQYKLDNAAWVVFKSTAGTSASKTITNVTSASHTLKTWAQRTYNDVGGYGAEVTTDCTIPTITNASLTPKGTTSATLAFTCSQSCNYTLKNSSGTKIAEGTVVGGSSVSAAVTVTSVNANYTLSVSRTANSNLTASTTLSCDTTGISISSCSVTPVDHDTATFSVKADKKFYWRVLKPNTSVYSDWYGPTNANTAATQQLTVSEVSGNYTIQVKKADCAYITDSETVSCDTRRPTISSFTATAASNTSVTIKFKVNYSCKWRIRKADGTYTSWSGNAVEANIEHTSTVTVPEGSGSLTLEVKRSICDGLTASAIDSYDSRRPTITNASLTPLSVSTAKLVFTLDVPCSWKLLSGITEKASGTASAGTNTIDTVNVDNNKNTSYSLVVTKSTNSNLTRNTSISCDTVLPVITIKSTTVEANVIKFSAESDVSCKSWRYEVVKNDQTKVKQGSFSMTETSCSGTITDLPMNTELTLIVYATKVANNLINTATKGDLKCIGCVRISSTDNLATVYIYNESKKQWESAVPYVCIDNSGTLEWVVCE